MAHEITRRHLLQLGLAGAAVITASGSVMPTAEAATARFPGHQPGRIFLGMSTSLSWSEALAQVGQFGLRRTFHDWDSLTSERSSILAAQTRGMLPCVSFGSVGTARGGWSAIASGRFDSDLRARARHYASLSKPVIATFCHEPHTKMEGTRSDWARAFVRVHDIMKNETSLQNVAYAPIHGDWEFNPKNKGGAPREFLTDAVLSRCSFVGTDIYQNQSGRLVSERLAFTMSWLDRFGWSSMPVGVGETGATNRFGAPKASEFWNDAWGFFRSSRDRVVAVSYFNSARNSKTSVYWPLDESADKLRAYKASLSDGVTTRLP